MKIISFTWTTPALLAGAKTVTRRDWKPEYAARFKGGDFILACDKSPRAGGRPIALIRLTQAPYHEPLAKMPHTDFQAEGFLWFAQHNEAITEDMFYRFGYGSLTSPDREKMWFTGWKSCGGTLWVVRFELITRLDHLLKEHAGYVAGEIERAARAGEAACVFCGCRDSSACINGCTWLEVDYHRAVGVCSNHPAARPVLAGIEARA
jgi:hypothetical protein